MILALLSIALRLLKLDASNVIVRCDSARSFSQARSRCMFVGLKRFSIIWINILRSTPGKRISTDSAISDVLSSPILTNCGVGSYIPSALGSRSEGCRAVSSRLSRASWLSNSAIWASRGFGASARWSIIGDSGICGLGSTGWWEAGWVVLRRRTT